MPLLQTLATASARGWRGNGAVGVFELISTTVLTGNAATVTFSLTAQQQVDYKHLQLRIAGRTDRASGYDGGKIRFNGGTSTDYTYHHLGGNGTNVASYGDASSTYFYLPIGTMEAASSGANKYGAVICDITDAFSTTKNKTMRVLGGSLTVTNIYLSSGLWVDTSAISSIAISPDVGTNYVSGSRFSLYGVR
jgi:uncharacterized protein YaiE (UPF0345 family)